MIPEKINQNGKKATEPPIHEMKVTVDPDADVQYRVYDEVKYAVYDRLKDLRRKKDDGEMNLREFRAARKDLITQWGERV